MPQVGHPQESGSRRRDRRAMRQLDCAGSMKKPPELLAPAGADAVLVQDLGLAALLGELVPDLPLHASTQMTLTEARGIELVRRL